MFPERCVVWACTYICVCRHAKMNMEFAMAAVELCSQSIVVCQPPLLGFVRTPCTHAHATQPPLLPISSTCCDCRCTGMPLRPLGSLLSAAHGSQHRQVNRQQRGCGCRPGKGGARLQGVKAAGTAVPGARLCLFFAKRGAAQHVCQWRAGECSPCTCSCAADVSWVLGWTFTTCWLRDHRAAVGFWFVTVCMLGNLS